MNDFDFKKIEKIIHYSFKDKNILKTAFTHSSYANEHSVENNERLEFLGDSILNFVVAEELFFKFKESEGKMSKWRSKMVNSDNLSTIIDNLELHKYLLLGKSFKNVKIANSIKENLFESIVGAIYVDSSLEKAKRFVFRFIQTEKIIKQKDVDYKTLLQEKVQLVKGSNLVYFTYELPDQEDTFCAEVYVNDIFVSRSVASTKKKAQMQCAKLALENTKLINRILENN